MQTPFNVQDLINKGLVKVKTYTEGPYTGLSVLKYSRQVFFKHLWNTDPRLLDCRGVVVDSTGNIISYPFTKVFNLDEENTTVGMYDWVRAVRKLNGFLGVASNYQGQLLVSTTGTLDSDFAQMAKEKILEANIKFLPEEGQTYMFEICHEKDPHIIKEHVGCYLIGKRANIIGSKLVTEQELDIEAEKLNFKRPEHFETSFTDLFDLSQIVEHEGFMIRDAKTQETLCKLKSTHYLTKKFLMRMSNTKIDAMYENIEVFKENIDEEFYEIVDFIVNKVDKTMWSDYDDQQRRYLIERYFERKRQ